MSKILIFLSVLLVSSTLAQASTQFIAVDAASAEILQRAEHCRWQMTVPGAQDGHSDYGDMAYDKTRDAFGFINGGVTMIVYRQAPYVYVNEPVSEAMTLKPFYISGPTATGVRMDYKGWVSASFFCWYMK